MLTTRFRALCSLLSGVFAISASAVPPCPWPVDCRQPDGTSVKALVRGNDQFHYLEIPATGELMIQDEHGWLVPADNGEVSKRMREVGMQQPLGLGLHTSSITPSGAPKVCVILVQFADVKFGMSNPQDYYTRWLNQQGFSDGGATGSVRDYFKAQSWDKFDPDFQVYGPVTLKNNRSSYASNSNAYKMVHEGAAAIDSQVDFKQFDLNGNGDVNCVCVIYAGTGANFGEANAPWPHNSTCPTSIFTRKKVDGKVLAHYMCACEAGYANPDGIGTFVHEFSHTIGLPDLYATSGSNSHTPGYWSVMDVGCYLNSSRTPCGYSAYERSACDWLQYQTLSVPADVNLRPMDEHGFACAVETGRDRDFYVLENRVATGWDYYLPSEGMLIWHIDGNKESSLTSGPNNDPSHMHVDLVRADNNYDQYYDGDPWPGSSDNRVFTSSSVPAMVRWNSDNSSEVTPVDKPLTDIRRRKSDGLVSFRFMGGDAHNLIDPAPDPTMNYSVSASPSEGGKVYFGSDEGAISFAANKDDKVEIHAVANDGYRFQRWTYNGNQFSLAPNVSFFAGEDNQGEYVAEFFKLPAKKYVITVSADPADYGYAYVGDDETNARYEAELNEQVRIHAVPYSGYKFSYWRFNGAARPYMQDYLVVADNESAGIYTAVFEADFNGIDGADSDGAPQISVVGRTVTVSSPHTAQVAIVSMSGAVIARMAVCGTRAFEISVPGIYVLMIDSVAHRIAVY